jgi:PAS domain S-box-containing protein
MDQTQVTAASRVWPLRRARPRIAGEPEDSALAAIVRSSEDAVIAKTLSGVVTEWNAGAARIYGHRPEEMIGRNIELTIPPEALAEERSRHARVAAGGAESGYHCTRLRVDGSPIDVVMSMSPVRDRRGQVVGVASISRPVSDGERHDVLVGSLLEAAPDAIVCVDANGRIAIANAQASAAFGYSRQELIGAPVEMLLPEHARAAHLHHRAAFAADPRSRPMGAGSLAARRRDGSVFPAEISLSASTVGADVVVVAAIRDVSAQRVIESALRESESRLRQLAESVDNLFVLRQLDPPEYLYVSPGSRTVLGREPAELMANPGLLMETVHPEDRVRVQRDYQEPSNSGLLVQCEYRIQPDNGQLRWVRASSAPVSNRDGVVERVVMTVEDITERVQAADALREAMSAAQAANEAKNQFLSRMSHELRTPLNAILGFGQLLARQLKDTEHSEAIGHVVKGGRHLLDLINDVLDIARIESGDMSISSEPVPVAAVVEETVQLMEPLAESAAVRLVLTPRGPGDADDYVLADRQRLRQILLNLLSNAIKYNAPGGHVWIGWHTGNGQVAVGVRDDGPGIDAQLQSRLFTPFDRLGAEITGVDGTGIGLALTRSLTEIMGGAITVESFPGRGSTFTVTLKGAKHSAAAASAVSAESRTAPELDGIAPVTLLYIEDNAPNVRVVEHLLRLRPEWRLMHAGLGSLGVELAAAHRPDLILLDLHLPDVTGQEVLRALRRHPATADTPVVVLTADASAGLAHRLRDSGANGYLMKPLDVDDVLGYLDGVARPGSEPGA